MRPPELQPLRGGPPHSGDGDVLPPCPRTRSAGQVEGWPARGPDGARQEEHGGARLGALEVELCRGRPRRGLGQAGPRAMAEHRFGGAAGASGGHECSGRRADPGDPQRVEQQWAGCSRGVRRCPEDAGQVRHAGQGSRRCGGLVHLQPHPDRHADLGVRQGRPARGRGQKCVAEARWPEVGAARGGARLGRPAGAGGCLVLELRERRRGLRCSLGGLAALQAGVCGVGADGEAARRPARPDLRHRGLGVRGRLSVVGGRALSPGGARGGRARGAHGS
mmetsp:Transcript_24310/g.55275  ORF Transcript_24310/g.55275 Transcript_24310/m.55275 type:complete len:278 (+) Transcript_24310:374-1207(+)